MKYKPLQEPCKSCLGCQRLEIPEFITDKNCRWQKKPEEWIKQIKMNLGDKNEASNDKLYSK